MALNPSLGMRAFIRGLEMKFPGVPCLTTEKLQSWLDRTTPAAGAVGEDDDTQRSNPSQLVVIDVRPEKEYIVSHIVGGIRVDYRTEDMTSLQLQVMQKSMEFNCPDMPGLSVVMYCSVGYRSSILATKLLTAIESETRCKDWHIYNLEGSLFKWATENRPMVNGDGLPTSYVHPYNSFFGLLVDREKWKWTP